MTADTPDTLTATEYRARLATARPRKYRNVPVVVDGLRFDSTGEAARWGELLLLAGAGAIGNLRRQVPYPLVVAGTLVATYRADFVYEEAGVTIVEDFKGVRTEGYRLKAKLLHACYGITIRETGR